MVEISHTRAPRTGKHQQPTQQVQAQAQQGPQADGHSTQPEYPAETSQVQGPSTPTQSPPPQVADHLHQPGGSPAVPSSGPAIPSSSSLTEQQTPLQAINEQHSDGFTSSDPAFLDSGLVAQGPAAAREAHIPQHDQAQDARAQQEHSQQAQGAGGQPEGHPARARPPKSKQAATKTGLPALEAAGQRLAELKAVQQAKDAHKQRQRTMLARTRSSRKFGDGRIQASPASELKPASPQTSPPETSAGATGDITISQECFKSESGVESLRALQAERARSLLATTFHSLDGQSNPLLTTVDDRQDMLNTLSTYEEEPRIVTSSHAKDRDSATVFSDAQPHSIQQVCMHSVG